MRFRPLRPVASALLLLALPVTLCAGEPAAPDIAVVPGADVYGSMDLAAWRSAPVWTAMSQEADKAVGLLSEITGLEEEDFLSVAFSMDIDDWNTSAPAHKEMSRVPAFVCVRLARPLSFEKLVEAVRVMKENSPASRLETFTVSGRPVLRVVPTSPREPVIHATVSESGRELYLALNEDSMAAGISRAAENAGAPLNPALKHLLASVVPSAQFRLAVLPSAAMRERLANAFKSITGDDPQTAKTTQAAMMVTFLGPIHTIQALALSVSAGEQIDVALAGDLAGPNEAAQCAHLMQSFIIPMVQKGVQATGQQDQMLLDDTISISADNATLKVAFALSPGDMQVLRQTSRPATAPVPLAPAAAEPAAGGS